MIRDEECSRISLEKNISVEQLDSDRHGLTVLTQPSKKLLPNV
jgi:hypothetical protein